MQEVYRDLGSKKNKEFEKLLNESFSDAGINEGKIVEGTVTKVTDKLVWIEVPNCKSEGTLEISELKTLKQDDQINVNSKISVFVERAEDRDGNLVISAEKAEKIRSWKELEKAYQDQKEVQGKIWNLLG